MSRRSSGLLRLSTRAIIDLGEEKSMPQFIDLSIPITNDVISDPPVMRPQISYMTHENTWEQIAMFFPGLTKDDLPDGEGWAVESLTLSTHNGTHMDAPWHFHSTTDGGASPAPSIDEAPLDLFLQPATASEILHRMLLNLREIHRSHDDAQRELAVHERLVILSPEAWELRRDRGLCAARLGDKRTAVRDLEVYLHHVQDAPDRAQVSAALSQLI